MVECAECHKSFEDTIQLHRHIRAHKRTKENYYHHYYPRKDLLTNELLEFKSSEYYFNNLFSSRQNCIKYISQLPKDNQYPFIVELFKKRKEYKELIYAPCQVELRASTLPSIIFLNKLGIDYDKLSRDVGLINRYDYSKNKLNFHNETLEILQDTREQQPIKFPTAKTIVSTLNYGDYCCRTHFNNIFIERKSPKDFISTFTSQMERFEKELNRAKAINATIFVVVELDLATMLSFDKASWLSKNTRVGPDFVFHNVKYLLQKYSNLQFAFARNRQESAELIEKIYRCTDDIKKMDLQLLIDTSILV